MKKILLLGLYLLIEIPLFAKGKPLSVIETEWGYEINLASIKKGKADLKITVSNKPDGLYVICDQFDFQEFAKTYVKIYHNHSEDKIPSISRLINRKFENVYGFADAYKLSCVFLKGKPIACSAVIEKKTVHITFDSTLDSVPLVMEYIQNPIKQSNEKELKELGFRSVEEFRGWLSKVLSDHLYSSLVGGWPSSFKKDDLTYMQRHLLQIRYMDIKPGPIYIYLVSTAGFNHCCEIHSEHQLSYLTNDFINEDMLLKYVGKGQYKQGFEVKDCDVFYLMEETSPDFIYFDKVMRSGLR